ncbi:MAG: hypothetical protein M1837_004371 [Sclerophora amabilis]|nr:MAG: hypothetical protein M1837_004371 [Sclerophora amabilis]
MAVEPSPELSELPSSAPSTPVHFQDNPAVRHSSSPTPQQTRLRQTPQDKLCKYTLLLDEDRFTFWDLIKELFKQNPRQKRNFLESLTNDDRMFKQILFYDRHRALDFLEWGTNDLKSELDTLSKTEDFGRFEPGRGRDFNSLDMGRLVEGVTQKAPRLVHLLNDINTTKCYGRELRRKQLVIMLTQMLYNRRPLVSNYIPALMGLHLHAGGTRKRIINLLITLANVKKVSELAKKDIQRFGQADDSISVYDNFEQTDGVWEQRIDDNSEFHLVTTGEVIARREMPTGGLRQDMLDPTVRMNRDEIVFSEGNRRDETSIQISKFFIQESISAAFPNLKSKLYPGGEDPARPLELPVLDRLTPSRTCHYSLGPIPFDESSNAGNLSKTTQRIRTVKNIRADSEGPFDSHKWILPIPALFHLKINFLKLLSQAHFGGEEERSQTSLYYARSVLGRRKVQPGRADFFALEEFIIHNFQARVVAALKVGLPQTPIFYGRDDSADAWDTGVASTRNKSLQQVLTKMTPVSFSQIINTLYKQLRTTSASQCEDDEYRNYLLFLEQTETYILLKYAIKWGDIGLILRAVDRCCIYFAGTNQFKYSFETLYFKRLTTTSAATAPLRRAILANSLVNNRGESDSWFETNWFLELHNSRMKEILKQRRTSSITLDYLFEYCSLNSAFFKGLEKHLKHLFGIHVNTRHTVKQAHEDINNLANHFRDRSMKPTSNRTSTLQVPDIMNKGLAAIRTRVEKFNKSAIGAERENLTEEGLYDSAIPDEDFYLFEEPDVFDPLFLFVEPWLTEDVVLGPLPTTLLPMIKLLPTFEERSAKGLRTGEERTGGEGTAGECVAKERTAGEGTAGEGVAKERIAGEGTAGEGVAKERTAGEGTAGEGVAKERTAGEGTAGEGVAKERTAGEGTAGEGVAKERTAGEGTAGEGTAGEGTAREGTAGEGTAGERVANDLTGVYAWKLTVPVCGMADAVDGYTLDNTAFWIR